MPKKKSPRAKQDTAGIAELEQLEIITRPSNMDQIDALLDEVQHLMFVMDTAPSGSGVAQL